MSGLNILFIQTPRHATQESKQFPVAHQIHASNLIDVSIKHFQASETWYKFEKQVVADYNAQYDYKEWSLSTLNLFIVGIVL